MKLLKIKPSKSLNKAYYKQSLTREQIELFKRELQNTFNHIDERQDEEYHKNVIADLFKNVYCKDKYLVNVNKKEDLVIRLGNNTTDDVGVLLEFKKPTEKRDMVSAENANVKALQEVVLYYLRQTVDNDNHKITNLVVTNIYEWFIFDGVWFEKNIFRNAKLKKEYLAYKTSGHDTKYFYDTIAAKYLATIEEEVPCTYFNLKHYKEKITKDNEKDDDDLIDLYKILSPEHLLNKKFANDSNSLNTDFYNELLYIIGLEESKETAKKTIRRINEAERNEGSLIENTISKLKTKKYFGYENNEETENQYYEVALELCITWLNRILFLKLLESQLIKYHRGDKENYSFLSYSKIKDFDELEELFFEVLAEKIDDRNPSIASKYKDIPYLNSSLFEMTDLERNALALSNLKDRLEFEVYKKSVLKKGTKEAIKPKTSLNYLLDFLDAYNFASESNAKIQEENKSIINASVLGLIFEKINGYKDGSFFTPGFITMYMCRETIRKAVVEKFKTSFPYCKDITDYEELKDKIDYTNKAQRLEANKLINDIKIIDPAVGSGHFLVSALNEMIAIKSDLQILSYANGNRVLGYTITLDNDELIIQNQETDKLFEYTLNQNNNVIPDLQELQDCLFTEKQTIIENCLFGVDINPKSVMICQLRLWIELLKNAYYTKESEFKELHTLPNIDINIKTGNSLISRFSISDSLENALKNSKWNIESYQIAVQTYKSVKDKSQKKQLENLINDIKNDFKTNIDSPFIKKISTARGKKELIEADIFAKRQWGENIDKKIFENYEKAIKALNDLEKDKDDILKNKIYGNAFEWRFEFPEVLDYKGNFVGFDVVIGNPPYISVKEIALQDKTLFSNIYKTAKGQFDLYQLFTEKAFEILKLDGKFSMITSNTYISNKDCVYFRGFLANNTAISEIINLDETIFKDAKLDVSIFSFSKTIDIESSINIIKCKQDFLNGIKTSIFQKNIIFEEDYDFKINYSDFDLKLFSKITKNEKLDSIININRGFEFGGNSGEIILEKREDYFPIIVGGDISKYAIKDLSKYCTFIKNNKSIYKEFELFSQPRILIQRIRNLSMKDRIIATYSDETIFCTNTLRILTSKKEYPIKAILGILNSKLINYFFRINFNNKDIYGYQLGKIPIVKKSLVKPEFVSLVDQILLLKKENPKADTSDLENEIDELVFELYDLTPEEVEVVKNS